MAKPLKGQTEISIDPAPNAIGRWDLDHEIAAYRKKMGDEATERQQRLARESRDCTCGEQDKADAKAKEEETRPRRLLGHQHRPGCNSFRPLSQSAPKISSEEQERRFNDQREGTA